MKKDISIIWKFISVRTAGWDLELLCYRELPLVIMLVGAGSIVTKDLPSNVVAVGNPCRVLREMNERDKEYYFKDRKIDYSEIV